MQKAFLFLIACIPLFSFAQDDPYEWYSPIEEGSARVISTNGLNLRSGPGTQYSRVTAIPLGAWLKVVKADRSHPDSLSPIILHQEHEDWKISRKGFWVEVEYKEKRGYMLDIFLVEAQHEEHRESRQGSGAMAGPEKKETYYHLSRPPASTANNFEFRNLNWYGLYETSPGNYELREIEITQFAIRSEIPENFITPIEQSGLRYVIGSSGHFTERRFVGFRHESRLHDSSTSLNPFQDNWEEISRNLARWQLYPSVPEDRNAYYEQGASIFVKTKRTAARELEQLYKGSASLNFAGDLDGDGETDYILTYYSDYYSHSVLYLSSEARVGQAPKLVATYYSGPCC